MIRDQIINDLKKSLEKLGLPVNDIVVEHPVQEEHGDYASNIALVLAKKMGQGPLELAKKIADAYPQVDYLAKVEVAEPGFLNFWLKTEYLSKELEEALRQGDKYGSSRLQAPGSKIMVEFAHPNTHKMFHIGHLRNITLGESIIRLLESQGAKVKRANYQGDVGLHIAKCLYGINKIKRTPANTTALHSAVVKNKDFGSLSLDEKIKILGEAYVAGNKAYEEDEDSRKEIEELNKKIYQKNSEVIKLWRQTRAWSLEYFERIYKRLYTHYDRYYFESEVADPGKKIVLEGLKKGIFEKSEGAIIFPGKKYGLHNRVFINQVGLPTYEAKDMGLASLQFSEFKPDLVIHVVGPEQKGYFEVVFRALEKLIPETSGKEYHLIYGWVRLKTGKMSSRTGEVVLAEWLLDEVKKRLKASYKMTDEVAEIVAVGAVKYSMLKFSPISEIAFDIDESINLEGDSGPYLQYTYARCKSVLAKAKTDMYNKLIYYTQGVAPEEQALLRTLYKFPEVIEDAAKAYSPNLICGFLFDLAQKYNLFYNKWPILKPEIIKTLRRCQAKTPGRCLQVRNFRLALTAATAQIVKNGLNLLGIKTVEKM